MMESVFKVASYIAERYAMEFGERIGEMKLHKLLYFAQRESLIRTGEVMFGEEIRAWKYGPVVPGVRQAYKHDLLHVLPSDDFLVKYKPVLDYVMREYAPSGVWTLVSVSHGQKSWKRARVGYDEHDSSDVLMKVEDMREDAEDAKRRRAEVETLKMFYEWLEEKESPLLEKLPYADFDWTVAFDRRLEMWEAFEDDECGRTAYYVVKDEMGRILFYFSLKTGLLYDQHIDEKSIKIFKKLNDYVRDAISRQDLTDEQVKALSGFLEKVRTHKGVTKEDLERLPQGNRSLFEELESELNQNITHVGKTYSGVELVHFCKNNALDDVIRGYGLPRNFGEVVFWRFIVPKIVEARELIGIQYFFLFAADMTAENKLIQYYADFLHFQLDDTRATVKPVYDFACRFMYQDATGLEAHMKDFWDSFNPDDEVWFF